MLAQGLTAKIHEAVAAAGMRAIISRGWGGLGELPDGAAAPRDVLSIGSVPHDWLFPQCLGPPAVCTAPGLQYQPGTDHEKHCSGIYACASLATDYCQALKRLVPDA